MIYYKYFIQIYPEGLCHLPVESDGGDGSCTDGDVGALCDGHQLAQQDAEGPASAQQRDEGEGHDQHAEPEVGDGEVDDVQVSRCRARVGEGAPGALACHHEAEQSVRDHPCRHREGELWHMMKNNNRVRSVIKF